MRRPPHGGTVRPGLRGPGNGYGRWVGRPEPCVPILAPPPVDPVRFLVADAKSTLPETEPDSATVPLDPAATG